MADCATRGRLQRAPNTTSGTRRPRSASSRSAAVRSSSPWSPWKRTPEAQLACRGTGCGAPLFPCSCPKHLRQAPAPCCSAFRQICCGGLPPLPHRHKISAAAEGPRCWTFCNRVIWGRTGRAHLLRQKVHAANAVLRAAQAGRAVVGDQHRQRARRLRQRLRNDPACRVLRALHLRHANVAGACHLSSAGKCCHMLHCPGYQRCCSSDRSTCDFGFFLKHCWVIRACLLGSTAQARDRPRDC